MLFWKLLRVRDCSGALLCSDFLSEHKKRKRKARPKGTPKKTIYLYIIKNKKTIENEKCNGFDGASVL